MLSVTGFALLSGLKSILYTFPRQNYNLQSILIEELL
jgi:hypothetical protein